MFINLQFLIANNSIKACAINVYLKEHLKMLTSSSF